MRVFGLQEKVGSTVLAFEWPDGVQDQDSKRDFRLRMDQIARDKDSSLFGRDFALGPSSGGEDTTGSMSLDLICRTTPRKSLWAFGQAMRVFLLQERVGSNDWAFEWLDWTQDQDSKRGFGLRTDQVVRDQASARYGVERAMQRRLREVKATKEDDAAVPLHRWKERVISAWAERADQADVGCKLDAIREQFCCEDGSRT